MPSYGEGAGENAGRVHASLYSLSNLLAISQTWLGVVPESSWIAWLRFHQMDQATAKKSSKSRGDPFSIKSKATSTKFLGEEDTSTGQLCHGAQVNLVWSQWRRAWAVDSKALSQMGQKLEQWIPLWFKLSMVGRPFTQDLHAKILSFWEIFWHQIRFQREVLESGEEHSLSSFESTRLEAMWYALLTIKTPCLLPIQMRLSLRRL